jgi:xylulokinase
VLGIASTAQTTTVEVRDTDTGQLVATGQATHPPAAPPRSEQEPVEWWQALVTAVQRAGVREVAGVAVAAQMQGLVCLDAAGSVLRPAKLWNDTEAAGEAEGLLRALDAERWVRATGSVPVAGSCVAKLVLLARNEPDVLSRSAHLLSPHDYLTYRLTGRCVTDRGDASATGYWSPVDERWRADLLARMIDGTTDDDWQIRLPEVLAGSEPADWLSASVHEQLGLRGRPLVAAGTGDLMASVLATGVAPGEVAVLLDEAGAVSTVAEEAVIDLSGRISGLADATDRFLPSVVTHNATVALDAAARMVGVDAAELSSLAVAGRPGASGVVVVPHFDGERFPDRPRAAGLIAGLRRDVTRTDLARATFEGVVCGLLEGLDALLDVEATAPGDEPIVLVGAGARLAASARVLADLAARPVLVPELDVPAAAGACVQAAAALERRSPAEVSAAWELWHGEVVEPDARTVARAGAIRARFRAVLGIHERH